MPTRVVGQCCCSSPDFTLQVNGTVRFNSSEVEILPSSFQAIVKSGNTTVYSGVVYVNENSTLVGNIGTPSSYVITSGSFDFTTSGKTYHCDCVYETPFSTISMNTFYYVGNSTVTSVTFTEITP